MTRFLVGRLAWSVLVLWLIASATFAMIYLIPADPARALVGPHAGAEAVAAVRHEMCLDRPFWTQYACHVGRLARGDLGTSFRTRRPVARILLERAGATAQLALAAVVLALILGLPLGVLAASRRDRFADHCIGAVTLVGQSAPAFFLGPLLMVGLAYGLGLFPISGYGAPGLDRLWHLFLPSLTLAIGGAATYARVTRAELIEILSRDYIRTARAKGLSPGRVLVRHALRNASIPIVTIVGLDLGALLGGALVTEYIFGWPGIGREAVLAIQNLDLPLILGLVTVSAVVVLGSSLLVDLTYASIDPRVRVR